MKVHVCMICQHKEAATTAPLLIIHFTINWKTILAMRLHTVSYTCMVEDTDTDTVTHTHMDEVKFPMISVWNSPYV